MDTKLYKADDTFKWYVLFTVSNKEFHIRDKILNTENISIYVKQIYLPVNETYILRKNAKVRHTEVIFPCYIFILANLIDDVIHRIHSIEGVHYFLGLPSEKDRVTLDKLKKDHNPTPLTHEEVIELIHSSEKIQQTKNLVSRKYDVNDYVCITSGIFRNLKGYVKEIRNNMAILDVEEVLNRSGISVTIPINEIEKVN